MRNAVICIVQTRSLVIAKVSLKNQESSDPLCKTPDKTTPFDFVLLYFSFMLELTDAYKEMHSANSGSKS